VVACALTGVYARPETAAANPLDKVCGIVGTLGEGLLGKACKVASHPKQVLGAAKALAAGKAGTAVKVLLNGARRNVSSPSGAAGIAAIVAWAVGGAHFVLSETTKLVGQSTTPDLRSSWFSSVYWRVAGVAALLTLPFLCAAALQAVLRSDGVLLARAVFGYLPLSFLATGIAAPIAMMLLAITDWMGGSIARAAGDQGSHFLVESGVVIGALGVAVGSPFVTFLIALLTAAAGLILWLELLIRAAAVYVVALMLPLVFAAMVWPARRVWAVRAIEVLVALILAKFAIVAVLALAAAALGQGGGDLIARALAGLVLVILGAFAPWALLRLLPLAQVASDAALGRKTLATVGEGVSSLMERMQTFGADVEQPASVRAEIGTRAPQNLRRPDSPAMHDRPDVKPEAAPSARTQQSGAADKATEPSTMPSAPESMASHTPAAAPEEVAAEAPSTQPVVSPPDFMEPAQAEDENHPTPPPQNPPEGTGE
jgi:hypothetical protein